MPHSKALAGHAHWQNVAKEKAAREKKRNEINTKWLPRIRREARNGSDMEKNRNLKKLVDEALNGGALLPAIKKQIHIWDDLNFKEFQLGIQGQNGLIALLSCASDAPKRTENEVQTLLRRHNFKFSAVQYLFNKSSQIMCQLPEKSEDEIEELALLCGTEDYEIDLKDNTIIFTVDESEVSTAVKELNDQEVTILSNSSHYVAKDVITISDKEAKKRIRLLMDGFSDLLEVETVYHNVANMDEITSKD